MKPKQKNKRQREKLFYLFKKVKKKVNRFTLAYAILSHHSTMTQSASIHIYELVWNDERTTATKRSQIIKSTVWQYMGLVPNTQFPKRTANMSLIWRCLTWTATTTNQRSLRCFCFFFHSKKSENRFLFYFIYL